LDVFLPTFRSLQSFLQFGGAPALWLISVASLAALFRATLRKQWRQIHWLNYLAFLLGTIHAQLLGTNFQHLIVRIVSIAMAGALIGVFVVKRVRKRRR
jgi:DMSO/TMAO reductase YedYZ heme-binding membrane subunit